MASGATFADALAGAAAAARQGAPLLLTAPTSLPAATATELARLHPVHVYVLGGSAVVSDAVMAAVGSHTQPVAGAVTRLAGSDRYATATAISRAFAMPGVPTVMIATGENCPDGLAAGPAAAATDAPLLLVRRDSVPSATATELARLAPQRIVVIGSSGVISDVVASVLGGYATAGIERIAGVDRYATSAAVSARFFGPGVVAMYVATGQDFPDALAAGPAAAHWGGPLLLVRASSACLPQRRPSWLGCIPAPSSSRVGLGW